MIEFREIYLGTPEYEAAMELREAVLRIPLGLSFTEEELAAEPECFHLAGFQEGRLVAILLLKPLNHETVKMRQVAVDPSLQKCGAGTQLLQFAEEFARARGFTSVIAHARGTAAGFYRRNGYAESGAPFLETTIPHILVCKDL